MLTVIFAVILLLNSLFIYGLYREVKGFGGCMTNHQKLLVKNLIIRAIMDITGELQSDLVKDYSADMVSELEHEKLMLMQALTDESLQLKEVV